MAVAKDIGIKHKPFPCRYCIADPISSSINLATWCSVTVIVSLFEDDDALPLPPLPTFPSPLPCIQSYLYNWPFYFIIMHIFIKICTIKNTSSIYLTNLITHHINYIISCLSSMKLFDKKSIQTLLNLTTIFVFSNFVLVSPCTIDRQH